MVPKHPLPIFAASIFSATILISISGSLISCKGSNGELTSHVPGGASQPVLMSVEPSEAAVGATVSVVGSGFSILPPENVVSTGEIAVVAASFEIADDGNEVITFDVPPEASVGENPLVVIVDGHASNALAFTVIP